MGESIGMYLTFLRMAIAAGKYKTGKSLAAKFSAFTVFSQIC
jgi:hypothetical protein